MGEKFPAALNVAVFGQTETSPITCVLRGEDALRKLGSVGRPIPGIQYRIVDADMHDVAVGEVGEIVYRGPTVTQGYWRKPQETARPSTEGGSTPVTWSSGTTRVSSGWSTARRT